MDLDGDGIKDIISGNYVTDGVKGIASVYIFKGLRKGLYAKAEEVKNKEGKPVIGARLPSQTGNYNHAQVALHPYAVDWDADGDLDLLMGNVGGVFTLVINEKQGDGTRFASEGSILKNETDEILHTGDIHSSPVVVDWDNDGDLDIVASNISKVRVAINVGTAKAPVFKAFEDLITGAEKVAPGSSEYKPNGDYRPWVHDVNGDGKLDILLGDSESTQSRNPDVSVEDYEIWKKDYNMAYENFSSMSKKKEVIKDSGKDPDENKDFKKQFDDIYRKYLVLARQTRKFTKTTTTGHVWLYIAK